MRTRNLRLREPNEAVARFQCVIEECEFVVACKRRKPQRQFSKISGERILVNAVETTLRHEPLRMQLLVLVGGNVSWLFLWMASPCLYQSCRQHSTSFNQERAGTHGRVADFQVENLFGRR